MFIVFLFICALPVLVVLFLIGLRILKGTIPILLAVGAAIAAMVLVAWTVSQFVDWTPAVVTEIAGVAVVIAFLGIVALLVVAAVWSFVSQRRPK